MHVLTASKIGFTLFHCRTALAATHSAVCKQFCCATFSKTKTTPFSTLSLMYAQSYRTRLETFVKLSKKDFENRTLSFYFHYIFSAKLRIVKFIPPAFYSDTFYSEEIKVLYTFLVFSERGFRAIFLPHRTGAK